MAVLVFLSPGRLSLNDGYACQIILKKPLFNYFFLITLEAAYDYFYFLRGGSRYYVVVLMVPLAIASHMS